MLKMHRELKHQKQMIYQYKKDGKLHSRYSTLVRCTPMQIEKVAQEELGLIGKFENPAMKFGSYRHRQFERESRKTGFLPTCFKETLGKNLKVSKAEYYFETELPGGVVIHSTCDAYLDGDYIVDYKVTTMDVKVWGSKQQLVFYAYLLGLHGIKIKRTIFLTETWNKEKNEILGYQKAEHKLAKWKIDTVKEWIDERVFVLREGMEMFKANNPEMEDIEHADILQNLQEENEYEESR